jgi:hypothetical protein
MLPILIHSRSTKIDVARDSGMVKVEVLHTVNNNWQRRMNY